MKTRILYALVCAAVLSIPLAAAFAAESEAKPAQKPAAAKEQEEKSATNGEPRNGAHHGSQQEKMKTCNAEAAKKSLKGDERRQFMSACLKG